MLSPWAGHVKNKKPLNRFCGRRDRFGSTLFARAVSLVPAHLYLIANFVGEA